MLLAARDAGVRKFVYAASSSTYGDSEELPRIEERIGWPMSPYAVTKLVNELYAHVFGRCYGLPHVGLRYFNVFGARQDPEGAYAAVIPKWIAALIRGSRVTIYGDGETSRDFCYVDNIVQANLLAAASEDPRATGEIFNVAVGERTSLNGLYALLRELLRARFPHVDAMAPDHAENRRGDIRHSHADIAKARTLLGYSPSHSLRAGLEAALGWYVRHCETSQQTTGKVRA
jgi:UDP-N-acetylglucosamine 4-epimerase